MNALGQDVRFALRGLRRHAGFALVAVLTLGIGIGANSAIFTVVDSVLLRPLPYRDPGGIVAVLHGGKSPVAPANYLDWRRESGAFLHTAAAQVGPARGTLTGRGRPETLGTMNVTADLFAVLGVPPLHGRTFRAGDDRPGAAPAAVLSHRLWQRRFGGDPAIVGQPLAIDGRNHTVVGVMPAGFEFPPFWARNAELWLPLDLSARGQDRNGESLRVFARLAPRVTLAQAQAETTGIWRRLERQFPGMTRADVALVPLHEKAVGHVRRPLLVLLAGVGFVLLIACANVANLLLARSAGRRKEMAIRASLGAGRGRLVRQLLTESVVLWLLGGALGMLLAQGGVDLLLAIGPRDLPRLDTVTVGLPVLLFTLGVSFFTGVLFGLAPALRLAGAEVRAERSGATGGGGKVRGLLVTSQVAMALVLLMAAGLMIRSFQRLRTIDAGFDAAGVIALNVPLPAVNPLNRPAQELRARAAVRQRAFVEDLLARVRALPGVTAASAVNHVPLAGDIWMRGLELDGAPIPPPGQEPRAVYRVSAPGYLGTMGMSLVRGRDFSARDAAGAPGVAIINETMARTLWPGEDPLGKRIRVQDGGPDPREIVGVVRDVRQRDWAAAAQPEMYLAYLQNPSTTATVVIRAGGGDLAALAAEVQRQIWVIDPALPASRVDVMERVVTAAMGQPRFQLLLLNLFAAVALLLAAVGIYGVIAYAVSRRTRELGIRLALGASARHVVRMVVGEGMALIAAGVVVGLAAALVATRLMTSLLYGVGATDPLTFALVPLLLAGVGLVACWIPARRATRIDPMVALRQE